MIKVLVADDEKWVRAIITSIILNEDSSFFLVGEATSGAEALELCLKLSPDILLTDIRMPELSGLELIEKISKCMPCPRIIIISGYDDFDYVQKALQLGAFDYLLKPIDEKQLVEALYKIKDIVIEENKKLEQEKLLRMQHEAGFNLLREKCLNDIIKEDIFSQNQLKKQFKHLGINLTTSNLAIITISIDDYHTRIKSALKHEQKAIMSKFKAIIERIIKKYLHGYTFFSSNIENEVIIIYNVTNKLTLDYIHKVLHNTQILIWRHLTTTFSAGLSSKMGEISNLYQIYTEAANLVKYRMIKGNGSIISSINLNTFKTKDFSFSKDIVNDMIINIELRNKINICNIIDITIEQVTCYNGITPELIKSAFWKFIINVVNGINCDSFSAINLYDFKDHSMYEDFKQMETLDDTKVYLKSFFTDISKNLINKVELSSQNAISTAKKYIEKNYTKDITLELISNYVFLNPSYFSELFKKETGMNFIEYITKLRIEEAKRLLKETNMKTYEISEYVGYSDTKYFSKLFKKLVGVTASEYRQ